MNPTPTDETMAKVRVAAEAEARDLVAKGFNAEQAAVIAFMRGYKLAVEACYADLHPKH